MLLGLNNWICANPVFVHDTIVRYNDYFLKCIDISNKKYELCVDLSQKRVKGKHIILQSLFAILKFILQNLHKSRICIHISINNMYCVLILAKDVWNTNKSFRLQNAFYTSKVLIYLFCISKSHNAIATESQFKAVT